MKLNHLDVQVPDVCAFAAFLVRHFAFESLSNATSKSIRVLTDGEGFTLVVQLAKNEERLPQDFHLGFIVDDPALVRERHATLIAAGVTNLGPVDVNNRGTMFYFRAPGDVLVEVSCRQR